MKLSLLHSHSVLSGVQWSAVEWNGMDSFGNCWLRLLEALVEKCLSVLLSLYLCVCSALLCRQCSSLRRGEESLRIHGAARRGHLVLLIGRPASSAAR